MNDKLAGRKQEINRKDHVLKEYRDKLDTIQLDLNSNKDYQGEIQKYKDMAKKTKLELDIKENQIKSLKDRI